MLESELLEPADVLRERNLYGNDSNRIIKSQSRRVGPSANAAMVLQKHSEQRRGGEEVGGACRWKVTTMDNDFLQWIPC